MNHSLIVDGETLTLTAVRLMNRVLRTYLVTVSHPEGGTAAFDVIADRGEWICYEATGSDSPLSVHKAVIELFKRASVWERNRPSHEAYDIDAAIQAAL